MVLRPAFQKPTPAALAPWKVNFSFPQLLKHENGQNFIEVHILVGRDELDGDTHGELLEIGQKMSGWKMD